MRVKRRALPHPVSAALLHWVFKGSSCDLGTERHWKMTAFKDKAKWQDELSSSSVLVTPLAKLGQGH
jgi:hypothetical protein